MSKKNMSRRSFIKKTGEGTGVVLVSSMLGENVSPGYTYSDDYSHIYVASDNGPVQNLENVIQMMGGIQNLFGLNDIVVIKTNAQWWNQGSPNLAATKRFIELILDIPGFVGEVIVCDNNHRWHPSANGAWANTFEINSNVPGVTNLMELIQQFQDRGYQNVTHYCWIDTGSNKDKLTSGPEEGDGYVYLPDIQYDNGGSGDDHRITIMSYPVFTSSYSGVTIDLRKGAWKDGNYTGQPVKFIVFSAVSAHYTAKVTSAIKNFFGVVDLSGDSDPHKPPLYGKMYENYYNFHAFSYNKTVPVEPVSGAMGGAVGTFLKNVRMPDFFVTTAEWVGVGDRTVPEKAEQTKTILASKDPVALDYYSTKYLLYPAAIKQKKSYAEDFNPDNLDQPLRKYLETCHAQGIGNIDEDKIIVHTPQNPVNIIVFDARIVDRNVELYWQAGQADKFFGFEIQKSVDNLDFYKIGFVEYRDNTENYTFRDTKDIWGRLVYRLKMIDRSGEFIYSDSIAVDVNSVNTFKLNQNYPNPFNSETIIRFSITHNKHVLLDIFDISGRKIKSLVNKSMHTGNYSVRWDGTDDQGNNVSTGTYIYQLKMNNQILTKKMLLVK